jgi:hypothetical protein
VPHKELETTTAQRQLCMRAAVAAKRSGSARGSEPHVVACAAPVKLGRVETVLMQPLNVAVVVEEALLALAARAAVQVPVFFRCGAAQTRTKANARRLGRLCGVSGEARQGARGFCSDCDEALLLEAHAA